MKYSFFFMLPAAMLLLASCKSGKPEDTVNTQEVIPVKTIALTREEIATDIPVSGKFTTDDETMLSFKTGGVIRKIMVDEGDYVRAGQVLATLDLTEINALVQQAELGLEKARRDFDRAERLYHDSVATREQYENARTGLDVATEQARAARFNNQYSVIRANADGYVLLRMAEEGQLIGPGQPVLQVNGAGNGHWVFKAGISDTERNTIAAGDKAEIITDADQRITATVIRRSEGVDPYSGTFTVYLAADGRPQGIASGLFGKGVIHASGKVQAWRIPYAAILDGDQQTGSVFITNDNSKAEIRTVKIHTIASGEAWVTAGLENARALIVSGSAYLTDQSPIRVNR
ncbi:MAG: efflux RND transporter periplasmic adaptor subunit [Bacteroidia bacterium]